MNNILTRKEYLQSVNEGIIGDKIRGGIKKIKNFIKLFIKKVNGVIRIFDKNGNALPVVTIETTIDRLSKINGAKVCVPQSIIDSTKNAGGDTSVCSTTLQIQTDDDEVYGYIGEDSIEYKNLMSLVSESKDINEFDEINERALYSQPGELLDCKPWTTEKLKEKLETAIRRLNRGDEVKNILVWGAPGVGKSQVIKAVIEAYNKGKEENEMLGFIEIPAQSFNPGDVVMPTAPTPDEVFRTNVKQSGILGDLEGEYLEKMEMAIRNKRRADKIPSTMFPCYFMTDDNDLNKKLDKIANLGTIEIDDPENPGKKMIQKTGGGGIIFFDEILRAPKPVLQDLMLVLQHKKFEGNTWKIGSKWIFVAASNRPIDEDDIFENRKKAGEAFMDRWPMQGVLVPDEEDWMKYMRKLGLVDENEIIFEFIFENEARENDEFRRWHTMMSRHDAAERPEGNEVKRDKGAKQITPRRWTEWWIEMKNIMKDEDAKTIMDLPDDIIIDSIGDIFGVDFEEEFKIWWKNNKVRVKIDDIIKDPTRIIYGKERSIMDSIVIKNINTQYKKKFKGKKYSDEIDEQTASVCLWLFINLPGSENLVATDFCDQIPTVFKEFEKDQTKFMKTFNVLIATFPTKKNINAIKSDEKKGNEFTYPGRFDDIMKIMKTYFPQNIDEKGNIIYSTSL